jgi:hypothetical protein
MKAGEITSKVEIQELIAGEVKYAKQHKQHMVWVYWNYKMGQMNFLDTFQEFKEVENLYASQGFIKDQELSNYNLSEIAKNVGAKEVKRHIFVNGQMIINNDTAHPVEPVSLFLADRYNAGNEFIVVQIKCC